MAGFGGKGGLLALVAIGAAAYFIFGRRGAPAAGVAAKLKPAGVGANEAVTASSYRIIASKRPGMQYVQAQGQVGGTLSFRSASAGTFTRNVVQEGGGLWAEIAA